MDPELAAIDHEKRILFPDNPGTKCTPQYAVYFYVVLRRVGI